MSTAEETVTADQPTRFPHTRAEALCAWEEFRPRVAAYAEARNGVRPGHQLEDKLAHAVRVEDSATYRAEMPVDADDTALPDDLPARTGLWVHADDLTPESAAPLAGQQFTSIFVGLDANLLRAEGLSPQRQEHLRVGLADAAARAGEHFQAPVHRKEDAPLPAALVAWAKEHGLQAVVALRPAVGPLHALSVVVRAQLAAENVALHLVWRPEDACTLPLARAGYFAFWQGAREQLLGHEKKEPAADPAKKLHRKGKGKGGREGDRRHE